ncbi:ABC transporter permease [Bacillus nakamurai]|uniref:ABC transporter permease n=1 Tax=Bacillus nakamurai TaxID=1793963 RepID=UPI0020C4EE1B|nr:ABC transporter permease [Bacillus nakamurai]MCP6682867.1 ABC transporter permease [Bacillus nakamurai]
MLNFAIRNRKEIFRAPLSIILGIALPVILLLVFTTIEKNAPLDTFKVNNLTPGLIVFSFAFLTMFSALLIAKDKQTALLTRLFASPLKITDYVAGYTLPMIPLAILQITICYVAAMAAGLSVEWLNLLASIAVLLPIALMSIFLGLCLGAIFTDKQISGIGTIYITLVQFLGGAWMDLNLLGETFNKIANALPFVHAIELAQEVIIGDYSAFNEHFWQTVGYAVLSLLIAILAFHKIYKK